MKSQVTVSIDSDVLKKLNELKINRSRLFECSARDALAKVENGTSAQLEWEKEKENTKKLEVEIIRLKRRINKLITYG